MREREGMTRDPNAVPALRAAVQRCPRCGARLGERAATALRAQRRLQAEGRTPAVPDDAAFCGCCGLLFASSA